MGLKQLFGIVTYACWICTIFAVFDAETATLVVVHMLATLMLTVLWFIPILEKDERQRKED